MERAQRPDRLHSSISYFSLSCIIGSRAQEPSALGLEHHQQSTRARSGLGCRVLETDCTSNLHQTSTSTTKRLIFTTSRVIFPADQSHRTKTLFFTLPTLHLQSHHPSTQPRQLYAGGKPTRKACLPSETFSPLARRYAQADQAIMPRAIGPRFSAQDCAPARGDWSP